MALPCVPLCKLRALFSDKVGDAVTWREQLRERRGEWYVVD